MSSLSNGISKLDFDPAIKERLMQGNDQVFFGEVLSRVAVAPENVVKILESLIGRLETKLDLRWLNMIGRAHRHVQEVVPH